MIRPVIMITNDNIKFGVVVLVGEWLTLDGGESKFGCSYFSIYIKPISTDALSA